MGLSRRQADEPTGTLPLTGLPARITRASAVHIRATPFVGSPDPAPAGRRNRKEAGSRAVDNPSSNAGRLITCDTDRNIPTNSPSRFASSENAARSEWADKSTRSASSTRTGKPTMGGEPIRLTCLRSQVGDNPQASGSAVSPWRRFRGASRNARGAAPALRITFLAAHKRASDRQRAHASIAPGGGNSVKPSVKRKRPLADVDVENGGMHRIPRHQRRVVPP